MLRVCVLFATIAFSGAACSGAGPAVLQGADSNARKVLFVGNSHTYTNDLPGMLDSLARMSGNAVLRAEAIAFGGYSLEDHWARGDARRALERERWDFVALQQGSSALPESQVHLATWTMKFAPIIRNAGAEAVLYQIWPSATRRMDAANALASYRAAAHSVNAILAPAGDAFTVALDADPAIGLYAADGLHASVRGTYLTALTLLARIDGSDPRRLPKRIPGSNTAPEIVRMLQQAAAGALARNPARP